MACDAAPDPTALPPTAVWLQVTAEGVEEVWVHQAAGSTYVVWADWRPFSRN